MTKLEIEIDRPIQVVWDHICNIEKHVSWMKDAISIAPTSEKVNCVGSTYLCDTKVGPLKTKDFMKVIRFESPSKMEMEHFGSVTGTGIFELKDNSDGTTTFIWEENLKFPWYMGASVGKALGVFLLQSIWRKNLKALKLEIEKESTK